MDTNAFTGDTLSYIEREISSIETCISGDDCDVDELNSKVSSLNKIIDEVIVNSQSEKQQSTLHGLKNQLNEIVDSYLTKLENFFNIQHNTSDETSSKSYSSDSESSYSDSSLSDKNGGKFVDQNFTKDRQPFVQESHNLDNFIANIQFQLHELMKTIEENNVSFENMIYYTENINGLLDTAIAQKSDEEIINDLLIIKNDLRVRSGQIAVYRQLLDDISKSGYQGQLIKKN